jgi:hypothetical protein
MAWDENWNESMPNNRRHGSTVISASQGDTIPQLELDVVSQNVPLKKIHNSGKGEKKSQKQRNKERTWWGLECLF